MEIRTARLSDRRAIAELMTALDYPGTEAFLTQRMRQLLAHPDEALLVAVEGERVLGVLSLHFLPQLALAGDIGASAILRRRPSARRRRRAAAVGGGRGAGAPSRLRSA